MRLGSILRDWGWREHAVIFLLSACVLFFELLATRATKIIFSNDFDFIVLALAFLGFGLGGIGAYFLRVIYKRHQIVLTFWLLVAYTASYAACIALLGIDGLHTQVGFFAASLLFYSLAGALISLLFSRSTKIIHTLYAASLGGSAVGALLFIGVLDSIDFEVLMLGGFIAAGTTIFFYLPSLRAGFSAAFGMATVLVLFTIPAPLAMQCGFQYQEVSDKHPIKTIDNSFSHIELYEVDPRFVLRDWTLTEEQHSATHAYAAIIDCVGNTTLVDAPMSEGLSDLFSGIRSTPYLLGTYESAFIMGSGLGSEIQRAVAGGTRDITAVEINPVLVDESRRLGGEHSPYNIEGVRGVISEGRKFLSRTNNVYDLINVSNSKRYGGQGVQPYALLENYLFTEEAFELYLSRLTPDGWFYSTDLIWFATRYKDTLVRVLTDSGSDPKAHVIFFDAGFYGGFLYKNVPLTDNERERIAETLQRRGIVAAPIDEFDLRDALGSERSLVITDDHPFFWNRYVSPINDEELYNNLLSGKNEKFISLGTLVRMFTIAVLSLGFALILTWRCKRAALPYVPYFLGTGFGFMMFEIAIMQKVAPLYASPASAMAWSLTGVLFFAGIGSFFSSGMRAHLLSRARVLSLLAFVTLVVFAATLSRILPHLYAADDTLVIITTLVFTGFPALVLGGLFPLGIRMLPSEEYVPWVFGTNGLASVVGSISAMLVALLYGFTYVFWGAAIAYLVCAFVVKGRP